MIGIAKLALSAKATMSLIILAAATTAVLLGKIEGIHYAAIVSTVSAIFLHTHMKTDLASMKGPNQ